MQRIRDELDFTCAVIGTGTLAPLIAKHTTSIESVDPDLTLEGLRILHERNAQNLEREAARGARPDRERAPDARSGACSPVR